MNHFEQYPGLRYVPDEIGISQERFAIVAPAIAQALHWSFEREGTQDEEWMLESMDTIFSYGAQEGIAGPQLDKIYEYAIDANQGGIE